MTTIAGTASVSGYQDGIGLATLLNSPTGISMDASGTIALIADTGNDIVRLFVLNTSNLTTLAGSIGSAGNANGRGTAASFTNPTGVAVDAAGAFALVVRSLVQFLTCARTRFTHSLPLAVVYDEQSYPPH